MTQNFKLFKLEIEIHKIATETDGMLKKIHVARLLSLMDTNELKVYNTLVTEEDKNIEVSIILNRMAKYCSPRTNQTMVHYKFFIVKQSDDNFDVYIKNLKT